MKPLLKYRIVLLGVCVLAACKHPSIDNDQTALVNGKRYVDGLTGTYTNMFNVYYDTTYTKASSQEGFLVFDPTMDVGMKSHYTLTVKAAPVGDSLDMWLNGTGGIGEFKNFKFPRQCQKSFSGYERNNAGYVYSDAFFGTTSCPDYVLTFRRAFPTRTEYCIIFSMAQVRNSKINNGKWVLSDARYDKSYFPDKWYMLLRAAMNFVRVSNGVLLLPKGV